MQKTNFTCGVNGIKLHSVCIKTSINSTIWRSLLVQLLSSRSSFYNSSSFSQPAPPLLLQITSLVISYLQLGTNACTRKQTHSFFSLHSKLQIFMGHWKSHSYSKLVPECTLTLNRRRREQVFPRCVHECSCTVHATKMSTMSTHGTNVKKKVTHIYSQLCICMKIEKK